jgi:NAD(P)-dependent dehydrogenase (short-subunit alcohol dehydrogenase family)
VSRDLVNAVVVITGASSGIGREAARQFAGEGSRLVLAARGKEPLEALANELGERAAAVPTDVRDEEAVERLAQAAVDKFGGLDVWVNGAGVVAYGRFADVPGDVFRAVIETNLMGQVHGARAALPRFRAQGTGVLINMSSVWGRVSAPDVSAYVTSKFAVRAFSECLRQELRSTPNVDVATMLPQAVDTPIFDRAANYSGKAARPIPPIVRPAVVAEGIVACARSPKREVTYSRSGRLLELAHSTVPSLWERFLPPAFEAGNYGERSEAPNPGTVLEPQPAPYAVGGEWRGRRKREMWRAFGAALRGMGRGLRGG